MTKDLVLAAVGAILGAAICFGIEKFNPTSVLDYLWMVLLFLALLACLAFLGPLRLILSASGKLRLSGSWTSNWTYQKQGSAVTVRDDLEISQYGRYLKGKAQSTLVSGSHPFPSLTYRLNGAISPDGVVEGRWWNTNEGRRYRGTFQGQIHPGGKRVDLKWLGIAGDGITSGEWTWTK
jgi:hypothetical protein